MLPFNNFEDPLMKRWAALLEVSVVEILESLSSSYLKSTVRKSRYFNGKTYNEVFKFRILLKRRMLKKLLPPFWDLNLHLTEWSISLIYLYVTVLYKKMSLKMFEGRKIATC